MEQKRKVEVFTAGCPVCQGVVEMVRGISCPNCEVIYYNVSNNEGIELVKAYGVTTMPAVAINGSLLDCCKNRPITKEDLEAAGVGR